MHAIKFTILNIFDYKIWWHERHPEGRASVTDHPALNPCSPASVCVALTPPGPSSEGTLVLPCLASLTSGRRSRSSACTFPSRAASLEGTGHRPCSAHRSPVRHADPAGPRGLLGLQLSGVCATSLWPPRGPPILLVPSWLWSRGLVSSVTGDLRWASPRREEQWLEAQGGGFGPTRAFLFLRGLVRVHPHPHQEPLRGPPGVSCLPSLCGACSASHPRSVHGAVSRPIFCDLRKGRVPRRRGWPGKTICAAFAGARDGAVPGDGALRALCSW